MKTPCSSCNQRLEIPDELAGQTIECPACNSSLAVPSLGTHPSVASQVKEPASQIASNKKQKSSMVKRFIAYVVGIALVVISLIVFWFSENSQTLLEAENIETIEKYIDPINKGNINVVKQYLAAGADANMNLPSEWTLLHHAADRTNKEIVKILLEAGANVNAKIDGGYTPLDLAQSLMEKDLYSSNEVYLRIKSKKKEIADLLRKNGGKTAEELKAEGK